MIVCVIHELTITHLVLPFHCCVIYSSSSCLLVRFIHSLHMVHLDLKPDNIFISCEHSKHNSPPVHHTHHHHHHHHHRSSHGSSKHDSSLHNSKRVGVSHRDTSTCPSAVTGGHVSADDGFEDDLQHGGSSRAEAETEFTYKIGEYTLHPQ